MLKRLKYVSGDYREAVDVREAQGSAGRQPAPAVLPRHPAEPVRRRRAGPGRAGINKGARVVVEKPFGRDLASAEELNAILHNVLPRERDLPHRPLPREGGGREPARVPLRQLVARAGLEPPLHRLACRSRWPRRSVSRAAASSTKSVGALRDVVQNHLLQVWRCWRMDPPVGADAERCGDEKVKLFKQVRAGRPGRVGARAVPRLRRRRRASRPAPTSRPSSPSASGSTRGAGPACRCCIRTGKALAATATEAVVEFKAPPRLFFKQPGMPMPDPNHLRFRLGKNDGITLHLQAKAPGEKMVTRQVDLAGELRAGVRRPPRGLRAAHRRRDRRRSDRDSAARTA